MPNTRRGCAAATGCGPGPATSATVRSARTAGRVSAASNTSVAAPVTSWSPTCLARSGDILRARGSAHDEGPAHGPRAGAEPVGEADGDAVAAPGQGLAVRPARQGDREPGRVRGGALDRDAP